MVITYLSLQFSQFFVFIEQFVLFLSQLIVERFDIFIDSSDLVESFLNKLWSCILVFSNVPELSFQLLNSNVKVRSGSPDLLIHLVDSSFLSLISFLIVFLCFLDHFGSVVGFTSSIFDVIMLFSDMTLFLTNKSCKLILEIFDLFRQLILLHLNFKFFGLDLSQIFLLNPDKFGFSSCDLSLLLSV